MKMQKKSLSLAGIALAGLIGMTSTGAVANQNDELLVESKFGNPRMVEVAVADLDLAKKYDRETLNIRIRKAALKVCDADPSSVLSGTTKAITCVQQAKEGAFAQVEARGLLSSSGVAAGGMD